jgi:hypothetical protein
MREGGVSKAERLTVISKAFGWPPVTNSPLVVSGDLICYGMSPLLPLTGPFYNSMGGTGKVRETDGAIVQMGFYLLFVGFLMFLYDT